MPPLFPQKKPNKNRRKKRGKSSKAQRNRRKKEKLNNPRLASAAAVNPYPERSNSQFSESLSEESILKSSEPVSVVTNITETAKPTIPRISKPAVPRVLQSAVSTPLKTITPVLLKTPTLLKPTELTRLESSESILPDLKTPSWISNPPGKTYMKEHSLYERKMTSASNTATATVDTANSKATFISSFTVESGDNVGDLLYNSAMDPPHPSESLWEFHSALQPISWLVGCWKSITAFASYPTMKTVPYREEMQFFATMRPVLQYKSETWHDENQKMMHCESGFLKVYPELKMVAFLVAHNFGVAELSEGTLCDQTVLMLKSKSISRMSFAKNSSVTEIVRCFELKGDILTLEVSMATVQQPLQKHLVVKYEKVL